MKRNNRNVVFASLLLLTMAGMACTWSLFPAPTIPSISTQIPQPVIPTATMLPKAQTVFIVNLPGVPAGRRERRPWCPR